MMMGLQPKNTFKSSIWGWTKNSPNLYSKWVHSIFPIDSLPEAGTEGHTGTERDRDRDREGWTETGTEREGQGGGQRGRDSTAGTAQQLLSLGKLRDSRSRGIPELWVEAQSSAAPTLGWTHWRPKSVPTHQEMLWWHLPRSVAFVAAVAISKYYYCQFFRLSLRIKIL